MVRLTERLIASIDLPEPEVMLEVEVMEIGSNRLSELGLQWPDTVQYGVPNFAGQITRTDSLQWAGVDKGDRLDVVLEPSGQQVFVLRALVGTAGKSSQVQLEGLSAVSVTGVSMPVRVDGDSGVSFVAR